MQTLSQKNILRRTRRVAVTALAVGACLGTLTACAPHPVQAQDPNGTGSAVTKKVSLNLVGQPVQQALRLLFTSVGLNNSIDQDVQGVVTINLTEVSFDTALRALLNAASPPLTYEKVDGVYHISVKREQPVYNPQPTPSPTTQVAEGVHLFRIPLDHTDPVIMAQILARSSIKGIVIVPVPAGGSGTSGTSNGSGGGNNGFGGANTGLGGNNNSFGGGNTGLGGGGGSMGGFGGSGGGGGGRIGF
jgi:hypothetical protein